jgi:ABC-type antimicrobial peptide transport system permease subunit
MGAFLLGVSPFDPATFSAVVAGVTVVGVAASALPASRAARVDPVTALRAE